MRIQYQSGKKIIKTVSSIDEMKELNHQLLAIWNNNSKFEMNPDTGHFYFVYNRYYIRYKIMVFYTQ